MGETDEKENRCMGSMDSSYGSESSGCGADDGDDI